MESSSAPVARPASAGLDPRPVAFLPFSHLLPLLNLLGRRRVFMAGVLLFTAASLMCGLAWSPAALLAARVVQGAGAAIMTPTALSIISTTFPEGSERNKALGIWGALGGIGATTAWLIGGPLVDGPGWRWIFFINIPVGLAALALSPVLLRESRGSLTRRSYDPAGALTITGALVLLVYAVVEAPGVGWGDVRTILPLAGSAVLVGAFGLIESRHRVPLVPLRIFRSRTLAGADALTVLLGTVAVGVPFVLTLYAQQVLGYSALKFGVSSVVLAVGVTAGAIAGQGAVFKAGFRPVAATGLALMGAGSLVLTQVSVHGSYFPDIFVGLLLCGLGIGLAFVTATVAALAGVAGHESGLASGLSNTRRGRDPARRPGSSTAPLDPRPAVHRSFKNAGGYPRGSTSPGMRSAIGAARPPRQLPSQRHGGRQRAPQPEGPRT